MNKKLWLFAAAGTAIIVYFIKSPTGNVEPPITKPSFSLLSQSGRTLLQRQSDNYSLSQEISADGVIAAKQNPFQKTTNLFSSAETATSQPRRIESNGIVIHNTNSEYNDSANYSSNAESTSVIYISDYDNSEITACRKRIDGTFNCQVALSGLFGPENITVIQNKLYITNLNNSSLTVCNIDTRANINRCDNVPIATRSPAYLFYSEQQLFISDFGQKNIEACQIDANGNIISCNSTSGIFPGLFKTVNYNGYNYSTDCMNNKIDKCINMYSTACTSIRDTTFSCPLTIAAFNGFAYIANNTVPNVIQCKIEPSGDFSACMVIDSNLKMPIGIAEFVATPK